MQQSGFHHLNGDTNIIAILSTDTESTDECLKKSVRSILSFEYVLEVLKRSNLSVANNSIQFGVINSCMCNNSLKADNVENMIRTIANPVIILGANFEQIFTLRLVKLADTLSIPLYSLNSLVPTPAGLTDAVIEIIDYFGWSWISTVSTEDEYDQDLVNLFETKLETDDSICVDAKIIVPHSLITNNQTDETRSQLNNSTANVVIAFASRTSEATTSFNEIKDKFPGKYM